MKPSLLSQILTALGVLAGLGCSRQESLRDPSVDVRKMSFGEYATWRSLVSFVGAGGDVNHPDSDGSTPLTVALRQRHGQTVRWLLDHGADANSIAGLMTPLQVAVAMDDLELATLLLSRGARIDPVGLRQGMELAHEEFQKRLKDYVSEGVQVSEHFLWPEVSRLHPMQTALEHNRVEMVRLLLKHGGKLRLDEYTYGFPPLHEAVKKSRIELAKLLIEAGEGPNEKSDAFHGEVAPLHVAARAGSLEVTRFLVEKGADVNARSADGLTPLAVALQGSKESFGAPFAKEEADARYRAVASYLREHGAKE